jgi:hypothetical protein
MLNLDLTNATEQGTPIPDGTYACRVQKAEVVVTKAGGQMIKVELRIQEGQPQGGRVIFDQFNIKNANPQAVQIGLGQLKGLLKAGGHANPNMLKSCEEIVGLKVFVRTKTEQDEGYGPQVRVKGYAPLAGAATSPVNAAQPVAAAAGQPAAAKNPFA